MFWHRPRYRFFLLALAACFLLAAAAAQEPATAPAAPARDGEPRGSFGETIEVRLIDVEVVVTDPRGNRVSGLGRDDFRLLVDGREVPVAFFDEVRDGRYVAPGELTVADGRTPLPVQPVATSFLLFIDDYFTRPPYRNLVLDGLEDDLATLGPGDRFAVVAYDGQRLEVLTDWTASRTALLDALAAARKRKGWKAYMEQQGRRADAQALAHLRASQLGRTYKAVATALRTFADVPGRRVALLLAGGWPYELNSTAFREELGYSRLFDTSRPLARIADVANATGFTLYPIDAPGPENVGGGISAEHRRSSPSAAFAADLEGSLQEESLMRLAEWTGGEALLDGRRQRALGPVVVDTRSYYWLSFEHPRRADGTRHAVEVEVLRPDLSVRARAGFLDVSQGAEAEIQAERALLLGGGEDTLRVEVTEPVRRGRSMEVPFAVFIPLDEVTVTPRRGGGGRARLELRVAVEDERGDRADVSVQKLDLPLEPAMLQLEAVAWEAAVKLRRKEHVLVFVLSDPASGRSWLARREVAP
jgi:VWFA-related protein